MQRHQRNNTTTHDQVEKLRINNFFKEDDGDNSGVIEFEPVSKNQIQANPNNLSKSSKTVREYNDGYARVRASQQTTSSGNGPFSQSQPTPNYQEQGKRQLSQNMPKNLLNVSLSTGANKGQASLNNTMNVKSSLPTHKSKNSYCIPQTTKNVSTKPPIGSLATKKKSGQVDQKEVSKSQRSSANHTRTKSTDKSQKGTKPKTAFKTERAGQTTYTSQIQTTGSAGVTRNSTGGKNLSAHLLEFANPIQVAKVSGVRGSHPTMIETGTNKENIQIQQRNLRHENLSGDDGDFSISSMSGSGGNKSSMNSRVAGGGAGNLERIFGKNYFVDGEQLMRHISPTQPTGSPRDSNAGENSSTHGLNLLNVTENQNLGHLRFNTGQFSSKRSKTTRGQQPQTLQQYSSGRPHINVEDNIFRITLDSEANLTTQILSGKTNQSQLDGILKPFSPNEHERSKSKGKAAVSQSFTNMTKKQKLSSVDKLIKKNIRQKSKQTAEEMLKKFMEQNQKKKRQQELLQMNQEIKKHNEPRALREAAHSVIKPFNEKKHRSRSCIQNRENFFSHHSGVVSPNLRQYNLSKEKGPREKSQDNPLNKTANLSNALNPHDKKRSHYHAREKNCVIELSLLKKEVDDEIRRDRKTKLMQIDPNVNMSAIAKSFSQKERSQNRTSLNQKSSAETKKANGSNSTQAALQFTSLRRKDPELLLEQQNLTDGNIKARVKRIIEIGKIEYQGTTPTSLNTTKIQKFIEKQKKRNAAKTKMQQTIEHEKILRVHENLTNLHNFTVNNRLKGGKDQPQHGLRKSAEKQAFEYLKSTKKRDRSSKHRKSEHINNQQTFGMTKTSAECDHDLISNSMPEIEKQRRPTRFNSQESRRRSSQNRYQDNCESIHRADAPKIINVYGERQSKGSSPQTRKLSDSQSRYTESNATSPQTRQNLSGSAAAPLRVLKPKLASSSKAKRREQLDVGERMRSIDEVNNGFSLTHGLYQSLESEKINRVSREPIDTSKQFESLEPVRVQSSSFDASRRITPERSHSPAKNNRNLLRNVIKEFGLPGESDAEIMSRLSRAASLIQRQWRRIRSQIKRKRQRYEARKKVIVIPKDYQDPKKVLAAIQLPDSQIVQVDAVQDIGKQKNTDLILVKEECSSERKSINYTGQSHKKKAAIPSLALHKVQSHDDQQKKKDLLQVPPQELNLLHSNRSIRDPEISTSRSIFERNTFRQFMGQGKLAPEDFNPEDYPKMLKVREEAIVFKEKSTQKYIKKMYTQNKISPRTFKRKNLELEQWVTKEKEEVRKTKKKFEKEWQKTAKILLYTHQNYEQIRRILNTDNQVIPISSRIQKKSSRHNLDGIGPDDQQHSQRGVLDMIYERDQDSKESKKSSAQQKRHSIFDEVTGDAEFKVGSESSEAEAQKSIQSESLRSGKRRIVKVTNFAKPSDDHIFRNTQKVQNLQEASGLASQRSSGQRSSSKNGYGGELSDDNDGLFEKVSVQDPQNHPIKDLRSLKINEKSEDAGSIHTVTPKELHFMSGEHSKKTSPIDNNASYIDKSMTRQFEHLQQTPTLSKQTGESQAQSEKFDSGKPPSHDSKHGLNTRKIDTNSSYKSVDSAPEPAHLIREQVTQGLNRVTSYNKLERSLDDDLSSDNDVLNRNSDGLESKNHDLKTSYNVIYLDQANISLAKKLMDDGSPNSIQSHPNILDYDHQKDSKKRNFFQNKLGQSSTNHKDLQEIDTEQEVLNQLSHLNPQPLVSPTMHNVTPLSTDHSGGQKIKIEISGQPEQDHNLFYHHYQPHENLQSPISNDSAVVGIRMGSVSLSSSTSKDGSQLPALPHLAGPIVDHNATNPEPDITFGDSRDPIAESTQNTSAKKDDSKDSGSYFPKRDLISHQSFTSLEQQNALAENSIDDSRVSCTPGANLSPQLQAEGEAYTNELLEYLLQELSSEGLDSLINRQSRRQQEVRAQLRAQCTGIKTDLFAIERYVDEIHQKIGRDPEGFFRTLYKPLSREALVVLNQLQNSEIGSCDHFDESYPQVLPLKLYLTLEKRRKSKREDEIKESREREAAERGVRVEDLKKEVPQNFDVECEHIHNKVLFDCINDSLLQFKPFGKEGQPLPWSRSSRRLKPTDDFNLNEIFEIVKHDLFRWAINLAGTLPRREFIYQGEFDEELFSEIREKKLVQLLAREMIETEPKWLNYEFEQAQVKIDVGDMILEQLVNETISILNEQAQREFLD